MDKALFALLEEKDFEFITIKEICKKAQVNRSTFYLHYDNTKDLLDECIVYINKKIDDYYGDEVNKVIKNISDCSLEELFFITPKYLTPYLNFIKDNARIFKTIASEHRLF